MLYEPENVAHFTPQDIPSSEISVQDMHSSRLSPGGWKDPSAEVIAFSRAAKGSGSSASALDAVYTTHTIQVRYTMHNGRLGSASHTCTAEVVRRCA